MTPLSSKRHVGVRVPLFWIAYLAVLGGTGILKGMLPPSSWRDLAWGSCCAAILVPITIWFERRFTAGSTSTVISVDRGTVLRLAIGAVIGAAVMAINLSIVRLFVGPIRLVVNDGYGRSAALMAATFIALSCMEELGFRGYPLRTLTAAVGGWRAQAIVAVAFGLSHLAYGWSISTILLGVIPGGILFGSAAAASGGLAMPIAVHAALNLALWSVGAKQGSGIWTVIVPPESQPQLDAISPILGVATVLVLSAMTWQLRSRRQTIVQGAAG
ncbi:MAG: type II CAAX endopeptidase family protein [bacterium]